VVQAPAQPAGSKQNTSQERISGCDRKAHGIDERTCPMLPVMRTFLGRVLVLRARLAALAAARICIGLEKACGLLSGSGGFVGASARSAEGPTVGVCDPKALAPRWYTLRVRGGPSPQKEEWDKRGEIAGEISRAISPLT
jgi:hypothetical protein